MAYENPHMTFRFFPIGEVAEEIHRIQSQIPGVRGWCWPRDVAGPGRPRRGCTTSHPFGGPHVNYVRDGDTAILTVPFHCIKLFEAALKSGEYPLLASGESDRGGRELKCRGKVMAAYPAQIPGDIMQFPEQAHSAQSAVIARARAALAASGKIKDLSALRFYQFIPAGLLMVRYALLIQQDAGTGKTIEAIAAMIAAGAKRILAVVPAATRSAATGWPADARRFFSLPTRVVYPHKDKRREREGGLDSGFLGLAIVAVDNLGEYVPEIAAWKPDGLIWDELDTYASRELVVHRMNADGSDFWEDKRTAKRGILTEAAARKEIAGLSSVVWRVGLTATTVGEGDLAPLWAMMELLDPDGFGTARDFDSRYAGGEPFESAYGPAKFGPSNMDEMLFRLSYFVARLPTAVGRAFIPACSFGLLPIPPAEQGSDSGYGFSVEEKKRAKNGGDVREVRSARAAALKRKAIFEALGEGLARGERWVIFTYWIDMADAWAEAARQKWPEAWVGVAHAEKNQLDEYASRAAQWEVTPELHELAQRMGLTDAQIERRRRPKWGDVIFANMRMAGRGTNALVESHQMWICELIDNPGLYQQVLGRSERPKRILTGEITRVVMPVAHGTSDDDAVAALAASSTFLAKFTGSEQAGVLAAALNKEARVEAVALTSHEQVALAEQALRGYAEDF